MDTKGQIVPDLGGCTRGTVGGGGGQQAHGAFPFALPSHSMHAIPLLGAWVWSIFFHL